MATAKANTRTVPAVPAVAYQPEHEELESVTLTLTPKEAGLLASMLGGIVGPTGLTSPRHVWAAIYHALHTVKGVNWPNHGGHGVKIVRNSDGEYVSIRLEWRKN